MMMALALLAGVLAALCWFVRARGRLVDRVARYVRWMRRAMLGFAVPVVVVLAVLGRIDALWVMPAEFERLRAWLPVMEPVDLMIGALAGIMIGLVVAAVRAQRGARPIGKPGALTPRNRAELPLGAAIAVVAGGTEEPFFRLILPLLVTLVTGNALAGFAVATLLFGALHRYQGWRGMVATTLFGGVMASVYLMSGALWLVVLIHALIDLNGLVVWPALSPGWLSEDRR